MAAPTIEPLGDSALLVRLGAEIDPTVNARVHALAAAIENARVPGFTDVVPAYASLAVHFDPQAHLSPDAAREKLLSLMDATDGPARGNDAAVIEIPVCYGGESGPDLEHIATHCGLAAADVVRRHSEAEYVVAMIGFAPGFPYLLGLPPELALPRRAEPRVRVPAGSVAIGGAQTGIYPRESPGGWHIIGHTPLRLFDAALPQPALLVPGARVRFVAVTRAEFGK